MSDDVCDSPPLKRMTTELTRLQRSDGSPIATDDSRAGYEAEGDTTYEEGGTTRRRLPRDLAVADNVPDADTTSLGHQDMNEVFKQEFSAFADRLGDSKLLHNMGLNAEATSSAAWQLVEALQAYAQGHIEDTAAIVEDLENNVEDPNDPEYLQVLNDTQNMLQYWELEHQTWELFGALVAERLAPHRGDKTLPRQLANDRFACDARIRAHFFNTDPLFREMLIILEWLRRYAPLPTADEIDSDINYRGNSGWMYTKEKIKASKRLGRGKQLSLLGTATSNAFLPAGTTQNTVTELDPDAPSRQGKKLEDEDEAWEHYLMKLLWKFLRKGMFEDAQELCEDAGEFWRAASLGGGVDAWDPKIDGTRDDKDGLDLSVKGNRRRELWKRMCYALAHRRGGDEYEKAVYGVLCGDVESVSLFNHDFTYDCR
jgi:nuclear pore complex protein Nup107